MICAPDARRYDGGPSRRCGRSGIVLPPMARQIKPVRLRCDTLLQRPAIVRLARFVLLQLALLLFAPSLRAIPLEQPVEASSLPDAPEPQSGTSSPAPHPGPGREDTLAGDSSIVSPATVPCTTCRLNWYQRFTDGPQERPLTPGDKGWLAARNFLDPFSLIAVTGEAGISVAADSHSAYGPGMPGFVRSVGVGVTEDMTGEFFGTFLIPFPCPSGPALLPYGACAHPPPHRPRSCAGLLDQER
jgi:hypothetical protein